MLCQETWPGLAGILLALWNRIGITSATVTIPITHTMAISIRPSVSRKPNNHPHIQSLLFLKWPPWNYRLLPESHRVVGPGPAPDHGQAAPLDVFFPCWIPDYRLIPLSPTPHRPKGRRQDRYCPSVLYWNRCCLSIQRFLSQS